MEHQLDGADDLEWRCQGLRGIAKDIRAPLWDSLISRAGVGSDIQAREICRAPGRRDWMARVVQVDVFGLIAWRLKGKRAVPSGRICLAVAVQKKVAIVGFREGPVVGTKPPVATHDKQLNRLLVRQSVVDTLQEPIEPTKL
jgi:hypothetical protein